MYCRLLGPLSLVVVVVVVFFLFLSPFEMMWSGKGSELFTCIFGWFGEMAKENCERKDHRYSVPTFVSPCDSKR